jgi:predicted esterase
MLSRRSCVAALVALAVPARAEELDGRLTARPNLAPPSPPAPRAGDFAPLGLDSRDAFLYIPKNFSPQSALPLVVALHGSGGSGRDMVEALSAEADKRGLLVLAPASRSNTWDLRHAPGCEDSLFIDRALARVFACAAIDAKRIALMGVSDGAAFALSLGLANGDLFSDVQSFSASQFHIRTTVGRPRVFLSHGRGDRIIPFSTGQRIAGTLSAAGYDVTFRPFVGGHYIPKDGLDAALDRFLG